MKKKLILKENSESTLGLQREEERVYKRKSRGDFEDLEVLKIERLGKERDEERASQSVEIMKKNVLAN